MCVPDAPPSCMSAYTCVHVVVVVVVVVVGGGACGMGARVRARGKCMRAYVDACFHACVRAHSCVRPCGAVRAVRAVWCRACLAVLCCVWV